MQASLPSTPGLLPSTTSLCQPTERPSPAPADVSDIYVWGSGHVGQLGLDPESEFELEDQYVSHPQRLRHEALLHKRVLQVCCGRDWTACLT
ncbi:regulator of chromosome condensation (RCC1) repeat domain containing protein, partial [Acanthamoeba castellanii str. Neff]